MRKVLWVLVSMMVAAGVVAAAAQEHRPVKETPAWTGLQTLVGKWDGTVNEGGKEMASHVEVRRTGDGSALMHWMDAGTPHEMITMFHPDMDELLATHYCAAHNQPRMKLVSSTPTRLVFEFKDGTNIGPHDGHMVGLAIHLIDADHHDEEWSYEQEGKRSTSVFHYARASTNQEVKPGSGGD
jgi:hypothetical protein